MVLKRGFFVKVWNVYSAEQANFWVLRLLLFFLAFSLHNSAFVEHDKLMVSRKHHTWKLELSSERGDPPSGSNWCKGAELCSFQLLIVLPRKCVIADDGCLEFCMIDCICEFMSFCSSTLNKHSWIMRDFGMIKALIYFGSLITTDNNVSEVSKKYAPLDYIGIIFIHPYHDTPHVWTASMLILYCSQIIKV